MCLIGVAGTLGGVSFLSTYFASTEGDTTTHIQALSAQEQQIKTDTEIQLPQTHSGPRWLLWTGIAWLVLDISLLCTVIYVMRTSGRQRGKQLLALLKCGNVRFARVVANHVDYAIPTNGAPRHVVALTIEGLCVEIRTFDDNDAHLFPPGAAMEVLYAESVPTMVFPVSEIPAL